MEISTMPKAYSLDLRTKNIEFYYNNEFTQLEVAEQFGIKIWYKY